MTSLQMCRNSSAISVLYGLPRSDEKQSNILSLRLAIIQLTNRVEYTEFDPRHAELYGFKEICFIYTTFSINQFKSCFLHFTFPNYQQLNKSRFSMTCLISLDLQQSFSSMLHSPNFRRKELETLWPGLYRKGRDLS